MFKYKYKLKLFFKIFVSDKFRTKIMKTTLWRFSKSKKNYNNLCRNNPKKQF